MGRAKARKGGKEKETGQFFRGFLATSCRDTAFLAAPSCGRGSHGSCGRPPERFSAGVSPGQSPVRLGNGENWVRQKDRGTFGRPGESSEEEPLWGNRLGLRGKGK